MAKKKFFGIILTPVGASFLLLFLYQSCAGNYRRPESFEAKMARFKNQHSNLNNVPSYFVPSDFTSRSPASSETKIEWREMPEPKSNKRLYFLGLYTQYLELKSYSKDQNVPKVELCPSFHSTIVDLKQVHTALYNMPKKPLKVDVGHLKKDINFYPEFNLPLNEQSGHPVVGDMIQSKNFDKGLGDPTQVLTLGIDVHLSKTFKEIVELCETGNSENYYNYENLVTYLNRSGNSLRGNARTLKTLMKTTLYSNIALLKSLEKHIELSGRTPASSTKSKIFKKAVLERTGAFWSLGYLDDVARP